jgi:L-amino acid N-acyltransferase YncA
LSTLQVHAAQECDAEAIVAIYNEGIAGREATFETEPRAADFLVRIASERYPLLVADLDGQIVGWAGLTPYSERQAYAGIGEFSGGGIGTKLCQQLSEEAQERGFYKLIGKIFPENLACVRLVGSCGFQQIGLHRRHGRLDGKWRDVLLVERLLGDASREAAD